MYDNFTLAQLLDLMTYWLKAWGGVPLSLVLEVMYRLLLLLAGAA